MNKTIKVNTDAALFEVVLRCKRGSLTPNVAEGIGIREALSWINKMG